MPGFNNIKYSDSERWYNKDVSARFEYVRSVLDFLVDGIEDKQDLNFHLKEALVGGICFSKSTMEVATAWGLHSQFDIVGKIYAHGYYSILDDGGDLHCEGLTLYSSFRNAWNKKLKTEHVEYRVKEDDKKWLALSYEHTIPTSLYIDRLLLLYKRGGLTVQIFRELISKVNVCYMLNIERTIIDKRYRTQMPCGWQWDGDPFARYKACGIEIWGGVGLN